MQNSLIYLAYKNDSFFQIKHSLDCIVELFYITVSKVSAI